MEKTEELKETSLYHFLEKSSEILSEKDYIYDHFRNYFKRISEIIENPLKLAVLGEFSAGKSTFINRLIGKDILPTGPYPITASITSLEYSDQEKIEVIYEDIGKNLISKEYQGYDKLKEFTKKNISKENIVKILKIKVFINNEILKYFNIIDTPGFNDPEKTGEEVTEKVFDEINYVIWIFRADQAGKQTEKKYLDKFREKSLYKDNIYAIVTYGDAVINNNAEYIEKQKAIIDEINKNFKDYFVNNEENLFIVSCDEEKLKDEFWKEKFKSLEKDLKEKILKKDKEISKNQLKEEYFKLVKEIDNVISNINHLQENLNNKLKIFINEIIKKDFKNKTEDTKKKIIKLIFNGVNNIQERLYKTPLFTNKKSKIVINSLEKFASFYFTAEELDKMKNEIETIYYDYIAIFYKLFKDLYAEIKDLLDKNLIKNIELNNELNGKLDIISANLKLLQQTHQLLIIGYIIGLLSDDFVYKYISNNEKAVENLSKGTMENLLDMDLDISYFISEIHNIGNEFLEEFKLDYGLLKSAKDKLKEFEEIYEKRS